MKRFNEKAFLKTGIIQELKKKKFYSEGKEYLFYMWDYQKGIYSFCFRETKDIDKSLYEEVKSLVIQLYWQHTNNWEYTLDLIYQLFDKVEVLWLKQTRKKNNN